MKKVKKVRDYAAEIDKAIAEHECFWCTKQHSTSWICNRIEWCYKFKHITEEEMHDFCDRMIAVFDMMKGIRRNANN